MACARIFLQNLLLSLSLWPTIALALKKTLLHYIYRDGYIRYALSLPSYNQATLCLIQITPILLEQSPL